MPLFEKRSRKGAVLRLPLDPNCCTDGRMRKFMTSAIAWEAHRHVARKPCSSHIRLRDVLAQYLSNLAASSEKDHASKALLQRAREYIRSFLEHGVRRRGGEQENEDPDADVSAPCLSSASASAPSDVLQGNIVDEARFRRDVHEKRIADQAAQEVRNGTSAAEPPPAVVRSFREAVRRTTCPDEIRRAAALQHAANARLLEHHANTVRLSHLTVTSVDDETTLVRVELPEASLDLDKASVTKKTLPKLVKRALNTLLTAEQRRPGRIVILSEASNDLVIAVWMVGGLKSRHRVARQQARMRHYVSGGWAKGCAAEPVTSPERLAVLWNNMMRLRAYGLNEHCTFVRAEPCGTSYRLIYRNQYGQLKGFQMGSWIDRAQLSRADLLSEQEYAAYDAELHDAYRRGVTAALEFEGEMPLELIRKRVAKLHLGLLASNLLDSRMRCDAF